MKLNFNNIGGLRIGNVLFARRKFYVGNYDACIYGGGTQYPIIPVDAPNNNRPVMNIDGRVWLPLFCTYATQSGVQLVQGGYLGPVVAHWNKIHRYTMEVYDPSYPGAVAYQCRHVYPEGPFDYTRYFVHEEETVQLQQTFLGVVPAAYSGGMKVEPLDGPSNTLDDWGWAKTNKGYPAYINGILQPVINLYGRYESETESAASWSYEDYVGSTPPSSWLTNYSLEEFIPDGLIFGDLLSSLEITSGVTPQDVPDVQDG